MHELKMMEKLFLLFVERLLMELRTEKKLNKLLTTTHKEIAALTETWRKIVTLKSNLKITGFVSNESEEMSKKLMTKMNKLLKEFESH